MNATVWKFPVPIIDHPQIEMPAGSEILMFASQAGDPYIWARVDPTQERVKYRLQLCGTGSPCPATGEYLGSATCGPFVWHLFGLEINDV